MQSMPITPILALLQRFGGANSAGGVKPPRYIVGGRYKPAHLFGTGNSLTTTATRLYYTPMYIHRSITWAGCRTYNQGTGDTGEKYRCGLYADDGVNGGPGTLLGSFGEVTLDGSSAARALVAAVGAPEGWVWFAQHHETAAAMYDYRPRFNSATGPMQPDRTSDFAEMALDTVDEATNVTRAGLYVDTAYGALASTAVTPTGVVGVVPWFRLVA